MAKFNKGEFTLVPSKEARRGLSPTLQVVYLWLSEYSDDNSKCYPSRKTLAKDCGISVRSLDRALTELVELGLIKKSARFRGNEKTTSLYTVIAVGGGAKSAPPSANSALPGAKSAHRTQPTELNPLNSLSNDNGLMPYGNPEINELFEYWQETTGIQIHGRRQANRNACNNLLKKHSKEGVMTLIRAANAAQSEKYAPTIADFADLQTNLNRLLVWAKKKGQTNAAARF